MSHKAYLTEGPIFGHLMKLALPALVGILCTFSFIIVDTYFISLVGQDDLTAISYATPVVDFIIGIAIGIGIAISSVVARRIGAGEYDQVQRYVGYSVVLCLFISLILTVVGILTITPTFKMLGANEQNLPKIYDFMVVWYLGIFLLFMGFVMTNALRAYGMAKWPAMVQILMAVINVALDPIFIFVFDLGIMGAAIAGLISRIIGFGILYKILKKEGLIQFDLKGKTREMLQAWKEMFSISIPASITNIIGPIASLWMTYLLASTSQNAVAGLGIAAKVQMIILIPMFVLSASIGPIVGQNFTAKLPDRSYQTLNLCVRLSIVWGVFVTILLWCVAPYLSMIFSDNALTLTVANTFMYIIPVSYIAWGVIMMVNANFNSLGHAKRATFISFLRMIVLFIPSSALMYYWFDYVGVFIAFSVSTILVAVFAYYWAFKDYRSKLSGLA
ncbi:MATE family efflux transporter [Francisellaceae bacterium]|nr:MATE family efflux transporter [Francisellaceae bacterium]